MAASIQDLTQNYPAAPADLPVSDDTQTALDLKLTGNANNLLLGGAAASAQATLAILGTKTIAVPAAGSAWNALDFQASTLTLAAGGVAPSSLSAAHFAAPTITSAAAYTVPVAATLTIAGPPVAAGSVAITVPLALNVLSGYSSFATRVGINTTAPLYALDMSAAYSTSVPVVRCGSFLIQPYALNNIFFSNNSYWNGDSMYRPASGFASALQFINGVAIFTNNNTAAAGTYTANCTFKTEHTGTFAVGNSLTATVGALANAQFIVTGSTGNVLLGTTTDAAASRLNVVASKTIASAAGAVWDGVKFAASTATITGATGITALSFTKIEAPTISGDTAGLVIGSAATLTITGPPVAGNANTTITKPAALVVQTGLSGFGTSAPTATIHALTANGAAPGAGPDQAVALTLQTSEAGLGKGATILFTGPSLIGNWHQAAIQGMADIGGLAGYEGALRFFTASAASNLVEAARFTSAQNFLIGTATDAAASRLQVLATKTIVSAAGAVWDGVKFAASTLTLTGAVTPVTALSFHTIEAPTITSAEAITVASAATVTIQGPPVAAGSTTITKPLALDILAGNVQIASLAGTGIRPVFADANGVLSAP